MEEKALQNEFTSRMGNTDEGNIQLNLLNYVHFFYYAKI